jgi:hypothetical protein
LPVAVFVIASLLLVSEFGLLPATLVSQTTGQANILIGTTLVGLVSLFVSSLLVAINRDVFRFLEGYGRSNPLRLFAWIERRRYARLQETISSLNEEYTSCVSEDRDPPPELCAKRSRLLCQAVERFPDQEQWLLPTPFGNIIRAFEVYSRVMYGLDAIPGWTRLLAVIPHEYRILVESAKAQVDFWVNLGLLSVFTLIEYAGVALHAGEAKALWLPALALCVALVASSRAKGSAVGWGHLVKSSFDVFLPELRNRLSFPRPASVEEERELWPKFSQATIYADPASLPEREAPQGVKETT